MPDREGQGPTDLEGGLTEVLSRAKGASERAQKTKRVVRTQRGPTTKQTRREMREHLQRVQRDAVPRRFQWATVDGPASETLASRVAGGRGAVERARAFAGGDLLLVGPSGAGKTSLACGVVNALIERCLLAIDSLDDDSTQFEPRRVLRATYRLVRRAWFATGYQLAKASQHTPLGQEPELVRRATMSTLLVLDDLGTDTHSLEKHASVVGEVIHERHQRALPTIITTYMLRRDIIAHYGDGIARRIGESPTLVLEPEAT